MSKVTWLVNVGTRRETQESHASTPLLAPTLLGREFQVTSNNQGRFEKKLPQEDSKILQKGVHLFLLCRMGTCILKKNAGPLKARDLGHV